MLGLLVLPVWGLLTACVLQVREDLRGVWMVDPTTGTQEWVEYGLFTQWFLGGSVAGGVLALGAPILLVALLSLALLEAKGRRDQRSKEFSWAARAGTVALGNELVVKKRVGGRTVDALPIRTEAASVLRRLVAKLVDIGALVFVVGLGAYVGVVYHRAFPEIVGDLPALIPIVSAIVAGLAVQLFQARWLMAHGQTLGKRLVDLRIVTARSELRPSTVRLLVYRTGGPLLAMLIAAVGGAFVVAAGVRFVLEGLDLYRLFEPTTLQVVLVALSAPPALFAIEAVLALGLLFGLESTGVDFVAGTRVVRFSVESPVDARRAPLGHRVLARAIDGVFSGGLLLLPTSAGVVLVQAGLSSWLLVGGLGLGLLMALAFEIVQWISLTREGTTLGKRRVGLVVEPVDGQRTFFNMVVLREWLGVYLLAAVSGNFGLSISALFGLSERRQCGHDVLANTAVVWSTQPE